MLHLTHLPHIEKGEKVIVYMRRHWFVFAKIAAFFIGISLLPLLTRWWLAKESPELLASPKWGPVFTLLTSAYYLYMWVLWYQNFLNYYLDIWIVTDRRIINTEQIELFNRIIAEQRLYRVQDVTSEQKGIIPTFLDYGDVVIQTAGEVPQFRFEQIPHPHKVAREINKLIERCKKIHGHTPH